MISGPPFTLERIDHVLLLVTGLEEALSFYEDVLGCQVRSRRQQYGMIELTAGNSRLDLVDVASSQGAWAAPAVESGRNVDHVCIAVTSDGESALRRHLATHRVPIIEERIDEEAGIATLSLYVRDPSGNVLELLTAAARANPYATPEGKRLPHLRIKAIDHVVLLVGDVERSIAFYCDLLGLEPERLSAFRAGTVKFASVRVNPQTIIDLFPPSMRDGDVDGKNVDHLAFDVTESPEEIAHFLKERAVAIIREAPRNFGALGFGHSFYVHDPDGNVVELRSYR